MLRKLLPAATATLLVVAACGSSHDALQVQAGSPVAALERAPDAAAKAGSAHVELTMTITPPGASAPAQVTGSGDYDTAARVASMELDYGALLERLGGSAAGALGPALDKPMRLVVDDTTMYLDLPFLAQLTGQSGWLSVPLADAGDGGFSGLGVGADPSAMLDYLRGAGKVTEAGHEDVDGTATTKYTATIDLHKVLEKVPAEQRARVQSQIDQLGGDLAATPITVWIDGDGLPRRMAMTTDLPQLGATALTVTWSKYGEPVSVAVPDPADVTPAKDALGGMVGAFLGQQ